jgi:hypothetical protein
MKSGQSWKVVCYLGLLSASGLLSSASAGTADHLPSQPTLPIAIPLPCTEDSRGAPDRIDLRKCSEVLTLPDKSGLVDRILEKDRRIRECKYLDYTLNVHQVKSADPSQFKTDAEFCKASGKPNFTGRGGGTVTCDWGQGEREKNHLGQSCGERGAKNGSGKWEFSIRNGIQVAARRTMATRLAKEILETRSLKVSSARCAVGALDYRDAVLVEGKKLNDQLLKGETQLSRTQASRFSRLCQEAREGEVGAESSDVQAACFVSAGRASTEALFALVASCEITSRTEMLLAQITDEEGSHMERKAEYCASREGRREQRKENGVRGARNQFDSCFMEVMDEYLKELYQRRFSARSEVPSGSKDQPVTASIPGLGALGFLLSQMRRRKREALSLVVLLLLSACGDGCGQKNCLQTRASDLTEENPSQALVDILAYLSSKDFKHRDKLDDAGDGDKVVDLDEFIAMTGDGKGGDTDKKKDGNVVEYDDDELFETVKITKTTLSEIRKEVGNKIVGACCYDADRDVEKKTRVKETPKEFKDNPEAEKYCFGAADGEEGGDDPEESELFGTTAGAVASFDKAKKLTSLGTGNVAEVGEDAKSSGFAEGMGAAASAGDSNRTTGTTKSAPIRSGGDDSQSRMKSGGGAGSSGGSVGGSLFSAASLKTDPAVDASAAAAAANSAAAGAGGTGFYAKGGGAAPTTSGGGGSGDDPSEGLTGAHDGLSDFGAAGADGVLPMAGEDPEDYFMRTRLDEDLFKKVEKKLRQKESVLLE